MNFILDFHRLLEARRSSTVLIQKSSHSKSKLIKTMKKKTFFFGHIPLREKRKIPPQTIGREKKPVKFHYATSKCPMV